MCSSGLGAARRQPLRDRDAGGKNNDCAGPDPGIARGNFGPLRLNNARGGPGSDAAGEKSESEQSQALRRDEPDQCARSCAEGDSNYEYASSESNLQSEKTGNTKQREQQNEHADDRNETGTETIWTPR